jgi:hypothetical protein
VNERKVIQGGATLDGDVAVTMRDGTQITTNLFRPAGERPAPVVMSVTPYGKDKLPDWIGMAFMRVAGVRFGRLDCSSWTGFESPDPVFWTAAGYAVVQADVRGMHKSDGHAGVLTAQDALDYYDLIEWAAQQPWVGRGGPRRRFLSLHVAMARRDNLYEVAALWADMLQVHGDELFYAYVVDNHAIVIPETIDAIRALSGIVEDANESNTKTNAALALATALI